MKHVATALSILAVVLVVILFVRLSKLEGRLQENNRPLTPTSHDLGEEDYDLEVAEYMARIHGYSNKLYFAAQAGEDDLVDFYLHEMEEAMEELEHAEIIEDGFNVSQAIRTFGLGGLEEYKSAYGSGGAEGVDSYHSELILRCNACHAQSGHGFLQMTLPSGDGVQGQLLDLPDQEM